MLARHLGPSGERSQCILQSLNALLRACTGHPLGQTQVLRFESTTLISKAAASPTLPNSAVIDPSHRTTRPWEASQGHQLAACPVWQCDRPHSGWPPASVIHCSTLRPCHVAPFTSAHPLFATCTFGFASVGIIYFKSGRLTPATLANGAMRHCTATAVRGLQGPPMTQPGFGWKLSP